ncbi:modification methylase [Nostoc sp. 'Peltigera membranacea cyanobiont' 213]|uniref:DNA adenine methylase n=1 Tax=Nostoc sp. 'Peltigera membranacea cyanobiont' 213 TaxID=2014530 RepID=UPI000B95C3FB|nr:Dam family site-specific DNA-(adenine-N6)-methyltransferase [Nostoc sp. 'Peltigera membranacea cyanobiont' 213]OYD91039.1 modification methylase [Nostoc sp. 'Peltigera membranacea cyanobiont' 213]
MVLTLSTIPTVPKPFLKWAGGKSQLIEQINNFFPNELFNGSIKRYIEPFIGGGAVFFYVAHKYDIQELFISDINAELVIAYKTIQYHVDDLIEILDKITTKYLSFDESEKSKYYYQTRTHFNSRKKSLNLDNYHFEWLERTAQIIFLNKTCFNGLFRVNSKGDFNVPAGTYKKQSIYDPKSLKSVAKILQNTKICHGDFTECESFIDDQTFVYFDPPYRPISNTSKFTSYSQQSFNDSEQLRLRDYFNKLDNKGALIMLSNSDPKNENINDNFFEDAYGGYKIERVRATRNINSNALKRNSINELLIMNY